MYKNSLPHNIKNKKYNKNKKDSRRYKKNAAFLRSLTINRMLMGNLVCGKATDRCL
jgi:hypothetical protein